MSRDLKYPDKVCEEEIEQDLWDQQEEKNPVG